jgi:hypothetical protein
MRNGTLAKRKRPRNSGPFDRKANQSELAATAGMASAATARSTAAARRSATAAAITPGVPVGSAVAPRGTIAAARRAGTAAVTAPRSGVAAVITAVSSGFVIAASWGYDGLPHIKRGSIV